MTAFNPIGYVDVNARRIVELADAYIDRRKNRIEQERQDYIAKHTGRKKGWVFKHVVTEEEASRMWETGSDPLGLSQKFWSENAGSSWNEKVISLRMAAIRITEEAGACESSSSIIVDVQLFDVLNRGN